MASGELFTFGRDVQGKASGGSESSLQPLRLEGDWSSSGAATHSGTQVCTFTHPLKSFTQNALEMKINTTFIRFMLYAN